jgi:hypothetical protein
MHPQLNHIANQHIADLHRAAKHRRLVRVATSATSSRSVHVPRHTAAASVSFLRWLRRHPA